MLTATKATGPNRPITGMSDAEWYGRDPADVDMPACIRAAVRETRFGVESIIHGSARFGMLRIMRARIRLAIAMGNESRAMTALAAENLPRMYAELNADEFNDRAELDRGVDRLHVHPELGAKLAEIEQKLAER